MSQTKDDIINRYNNNMRMLGKIMKSKLTNDKNVEHITIRLNTAIQFDPLVLLRESGPYFVKYKEQIKTKDMSYFLNKDDWSDDVTSEKEDEKNLSHDIINKVKQIWVTLSDKEKTMLYSITESLLVDYCNFLLH